MKKQKIHIFGGVDLNNADSIKAKFKNIVLKKGIRSTETIQNILGIRDYEEFYIVIKNLEAIGKLKPTHDGHETNGKNPPLAKKYRIIDETESTDEYVTEINQSFLFVYSKSYYKSHIKQYKKDRNIIKQLINYHKRKHGPLKTNMSPNERLFDIFGHEKEIMIDRVYRILERLGLPKEYLNVYKTPEPFIYYCATQQLSQQILIVENKDTWYTLCRLRKEGIGPFDSIIYGEGKKVISSIEELGLHEKSWFNNVENNFYYFGDLDDEGLRIFESVKEKGYNRGYKIELWAESYKMMLELAQEKDSWRKYKDQTSLTKNKVEEVLYFLNQQYIEQVFDKFSANLYIPQESLNYMILQKMLQSAKGE